MSTDPDQENRRDTDITDELPILIETVVLEPGEGSKLADARDDTGEHTGNFSTLAGHEADGVAALKHDLERRAAKIEELEGEIARQSKRWLDVERLLVEKDAQIGDLSSALASARTDLVEHSASEERLTAEIVDRDNQFAGLLSQLELLRAEVVEARAEVERQQRERETERDEIAKARADLHRRVIAAATPSEQDLHEELDALKSYVTNRSVWWAELESRAAGHASRIAELEREVAHRTARQQQTEELAARETARAEGLRDELVTEARRAEALEAELRKIHAEPSATAAAELDAAREALAAAQRERDRAIEEVAALRERDQRQAEEIALATQQRAAAERAARASAELLVASRGDEAGATVSTAEVAAQLEAELEQKRTELSSERAASRARQDSLAAATAGLEAARGQLAEARAQLEQAHADAARLERTLIDKDRALEARDERIHTLQSELDRKRAGPQKSNAPDVSLQALDSKTSERLRRTDSPAEPPNTPTLICLTSDSPRQYALAKRSMTIGRSSRCDIQILTHFVSREHARLTVSPESNVVIEDLGSTNGVFVNSVRIDRQELRHGDLVTVGETQFRFLATMAH